LYFYSVEILQILNKRILKFELDLDFVLIAITSSLRDYRICYLLNRSLNFDFIKTDDLLLDSAVKDGHTYFSLYKYNWEHTETDFYVISNKGTGGLLIPEMPTTDFLLMIKNYIDDDDLENIVQGINKIPEIVSAVKVDPKKIKSRENLLF
jgi:hypothetical protein